MEKSSCFSVLIVLWFYLAGPAVPASGVQLVDDLGAEVELAHPAQRIVSLAPSNTELLFALGLGEKLVGVTQSCNYPVAAVDIEKVADFSSMSIEKIIAVKPDLVVAARGNDLEGLKTLRSIGIQVFALDIQTVEQLFQAIQRLSQLTGMEKEATNLIGDLQGRVGKIVAAVDSLERRPRVMWGYWSDPVYTAGKGSMIDDVIHLAGGVNVARAAPGTWPQVGLETIISWAPQVIITTYLPNVTDAEGLEREIHRLQEVDGWKSVPAVRQGRIYYIESDWLMRPGPRLINALEHIATLLHPGVFSE